MLIYPFQDTYLFTLLTRSTVILLLVLAFQSAFAQKSSDPQPNKEYSEAISIADKHLLTGEYLKARNEYEKAWNLYQRQTYPESKIDQISKTLANTPISAMLYDKAIKTGDSCFFAKDYKSANTEYFNALRLDPSAQYPKKKLNEVSSVFVDPENETRFRIVLIHAGKSFDRAKYDKAISYYQQAILIKPSEKWIEKKMDETTVLKEKTLSGMDPYTRCLEESENLMEQKKWAEARDGFAKALAMRPKENYPAAKIVLLDHLPAFTKSGEPTYSSLIEDADKFCKFQDYENAAIHFQEAQNMKPDEAYPKNMLKKLGNKSDDAEAISQNHAAAVINADILSLAGDTKAALIGYKRCIAKQTGDIYVKSRITELTAVSNSSNESSTAFQLAVAKGDKSMASLNYSKALSEFRYASILKPAESYPKEKIEEIQKLIQLAKVIEAAKQEAQIEPVTAQLQKDDSKVKSETKPVDNLTPAEDMPQQKSATLSIVSEEGKQKDFNHADGISQQNSTTQNIAGEEQKIKDGDLKGVPVYANNDSKNIDFAQTNVGNLAGQIKLQVSPPLEKTNASETLISEPKLESEPVDKLIDVEEISSSQKQNPVITLKDKSAVSNLQDENYFQKRNEVNNAAIENINMVAAVISTPVSAPVLPKEKKDLPTVSTATSKGTEPKNLPAAHKIQEKPVITKPVLPEQNANQEKYDKAIAFADKAFDEKNYHYAANGYKAALKIKPAEKYPQEKIATIKSFQDQENTSVENYKKTILAADKAFAEKDYLKAKANNRVALTLNPIRKNPQEKIAAIDVILGQQKVRQNKYNTAIANADNDYDSKDFVSAITEYKAALSISPAESYPKERIDAISTLMSREKVAHENYTKAIMAAEKAFAAKDYSTSISGFQTAMKLKPEENYPQQRITFINNLLALNKEKRENQYAEYLGQADNHYSKQDFAAAQKEYKMASELKPDEAYPRERNKLIAEMLMAKSRETKAAYEGAIADADKAYKALIYDQAVLLYSKALEIKPGEIYPGQMIARIRKNMMDHSIVEITTQDFILKNDTEKRFSFLPVNVAMRKNNYLVIRTRISGDSQPKLYINYGRETSKNGGVVVKNINSEMLNDFVINISIQDKWFREDNNWLSLYSENGDLEVASIRISQGR